VTETDQAVEKHIATRLKTLYPSFLFVGEETYVAGETKIPFEPVFIVDPIDGTTNFIHGFPNACISLGFALGSRPSVGVVYNPFQDKLYTGILGSGAYVQRNASLAARGILKDGGEGCERVRLPAAGNGDAKKAPALRDLSTALLACEVSSFEDTIFPL
jgi:myo-inositol-1(or 4)-monophosphatase